MKEYDIVSSIWKHIAVHKRTYIRVASYVEDILKPPESLVKRLMNYVNLFLG